MLAPTLAQIMKGNSLNLLLKFGEAKELGKEKNLYPESFQAITFLVEGNRSNASTRFQSCKLYDPKMYKEAITTEDRAF